LLETKIESIKKTKSVLTYTLTDAPPVLTEIKRYLPPACLAGPKTVIPGLLFQTQQLPSELAGVANDAFAPRIPLYLHSLELKGLETLEESFRSYLRQLCESESRLEAKLLSKSTQGAVISQRALTLVAHNTWHALGQPAVCIIKKMGSQSNAQYVLQTPFRVPTYYS